jgi:arylsulfatase A-like enzyme
MMEGEIMNRRQFIKSTAIFSLSSFFINCQNTKKKPNIIYVLADDLGYGDLSLYGQDKFKTPNIDRLAIEGMNFTNHYSGSTVCAPSRCSLMTGLHTGHTQVRGNKEIEPEGQAPMESGTVTIPTLLKKGGYVSGMFGKWGLGYPGSASDPMIFFDGFYGYNCQRYAHRYYPAYLWHNDKKVELKGNHWINKNTFAPDIIHEKALEFIEKNNPKKTGKPFFLYYPSTIPHAELIAPEDEILQQFIGKFDERPFPGGNTQDVKSAAYGPNMSIPAYCPQENPKAVFAALITRLDRQVGEIIKKLQELGIDDNTIVIFTSDNGAHAEGGIHPDDFNSNGKWRGMKRDLYEGGIRVPMIVRWPGKVKAGTTSDHISAFWDILPTFCEIGGVAAPANIDGISMLPVLLGHDSEQKQHEYLYWEFPALGGRQAIRKGHWKGVRYNVKGNPEAEIELYNLDDDPSEKNNIASEFPEIIREMKGLFEKARAGSETFPLFK